MNRFSEMLTQRSLLEGNRDHLLTQARAELMKQELRNKLVLNDWIWRTPITQMLNPNWNKFEYKTD